MKAIACHTGLPGIADGNMMGPFCGPLTWQWTLGWKQESSLGKGFVSALSPVSHDAEALCEGAGVHSRFGLHQLRTGNPAAGGFRVTNAALEKVAGLYL